MLGKSEFEQSPLGMWLSNHKKAIFFQVPSATGPSVAGKGWAEGRSLRSGNFRPECDPGPSALLFSTIACAQLPPRLLCILRTHSRHPPCWAHPPYTSGSAHLANLFSESSCSPSHQPYQFPNIPKSSLPRAPVQAAPSARSTLLCSADPRVSG